MRLCVKSFPVTHAEAKQRHAELSADIRRHDIYLGESRVDGKAVALPSDKGAVLIAGSSGAGRPH